MNTCRRTVTRALVVGVNDYSSTGPGPNLNGCVADAQAFRNMLLSARVSMSNIELVTDRRATRDRVLATLRRLVAATRPRDVLVFYFAGHGTQLPASLDPNEPDGLTEAICLHDLQQGGVILDDEIAMALAQVPPTAGVHTFMDCCHAQSISRAVPVPFARARTIVLDKDHPACDVVGAWVETRRLSAMPPVPEWQPNLAEWAACQAEQQAMETEVDGGPRGVFTYALANYGRSWNGVQHATRAELFGRVRDALHNTSGGTQSPTLMLGESLPGDDLIFSLPK